MRRLLCCIACVLALMLEVGAQASAATDRQQLIDRAQVLLSQGQMDAVIALLKPMVKGEDAQLNHLLALAYYGKGDYPSAATHFSRSVASAPRGGKQYRQAVQLLGLSHYFQGHIKEAIPRLEEAAALAPENVEISYALGNCYIQSHETAKSRAVFARIFRLEPESAAAHLVNAQMMIRQQLEELAEGELRRALELDGRLPQANFLLGELAIYKANIDQGIELLKKELAINPAFAMAYYRLGEAYTRQLRWEEAIAPLQQSIWLNPFFSGPYIVLGKVYLKKGDLANAENVLRRALRMDPNNYSGHHLLAQVLQQANRHEEAKREFELAERLRLAGGN
ncbi:MAG: hypothetical protein C4334_12755 [Pyrinomonas sp.]|uniref:tetratricopeptide repeat protein n=1 Tax=Pyrinomonas sp. TaxID=2080306 RepID=UPI0033204094